MVIWPHEGNGEGNGLLDGVESEGQVARLVFRAKFTWNPYNSSLIELKVLYFVAFSIVTTNLGGNREYSRRESDIGFH